MRCDFDDRMRLHALPLAKLLQIETSARDNTRLRLTFDEGVYSFCTLIFRNHVDLERFVKYLVQQNELGQLEDVDTVNEESVTIGKLMKKLNEMERMQMDMASLLQAYSKVNRKQSSCGQKCEEPF